MGNYEFVVSEGLERGRTYAFPGSYFYVGAGEECHLRLHGEEVQARHAEVRFDAAGVPWIRDLTGKQLVLLNGQPTEHAAMVPGSFVRLGRLELVIRQLASHAGPSGTVSTPTPMMSAVPTQNQSFEPTSKRSTPFSSVAHGAVGPAEERPIPLPQENVVSTILLPGSIIDGRYQVVGKIAAGGMGEVYRAQHVELGKHMAVKVMLPSLSNDPEFVARFKREAIAAAMRASEFIRVNSRNCGRCTSRVMKKEL